MGDISPVAVDTTKWIDLFLDETHGTVQKPYNGWLLPFL
jgi:hypothetical protein